MIKKKILCPDKTRKIQGSFAAIEHRFVRDGFFGSLTHSELLLYFFLVMVSDRYGLSYYAYDKICSCLQMPVEDYMEARNGLIEKELIAFDGTLFQVLRLPDTPAKGPLFYSGHRRIWKGTIPPPYTGYFLSLENGCVTKTPQSRQGCEAPRLIAELLEGG